MGWVAVRCLRRELGALRHGRHATRRDARALYEADTDDAAVVAGERAFTLPGAHAPDADAAVVGARDEPIFVPAWRADEWRVSSG